ncbi:MAG: D-tyrosyl-tRNA(Tyr) deacylase [Opitutae bacterium]|nr:D-tyrosyl-tRNA(Tyr) deacylase [Opitutae bacterium]
MRVLIQRVRSASVTVDGRITGEIGRGLLVFQGIAADDTAADGEWLAQKLAKLRIFEDADGKMNLSLADLAARAPSSPAAKRLDEPRQSPQDDGGRPLILLVSQFTLHASTAKGTRPSFNAAARPEIARPLYDLFQQQLAAALGRPVATGEFGAMMQVTLVNDGPVTLLIDSKQRE